jgi:hypothetical protein
MPTVYLAIDARKAQDGARDFEGAMGRSAAAAKRVDDVMPQLVKKFSLTADEAAKVRTRLLAQDSAMERVAQTATRTGRSFDVMSKAQGTLNKALDVGGNLAKGFLTSLAISPVLALGSALATAALNMVGFGDASDKAAASQDRATEAQKRFNDQLDRTLEYQRRQQRIPSSDEVRREATIRQLRELEQSLGGSANAYTPTGQAGKLLGPLGLDASGLPTRRFETTKTDGLFGGFTPASFEDRVANVDLIRLIDARADALEKEAAAAESVQKSVTAATARTAASGGRTYPGGEAALAGLGYGGVDGPSLSSQIAGYNARNASPFTLSERRAFDEIRAGRGGGFAGTGQAALLGLDVPGQSGGDLVSQINAYNRANPAGARAASRFGGEPIQRAVADEIVTDDALDRFNDQVADGFSDAITRGLLSGDVASAIQSIGNQIAATVVQESIAKPAASALSDAIGLASLFAANGHAFDNGSLIPFANGGIVDKPTQFSFGGGKRGIAGEAGTEAILPLSRGPNGKLGVESRGGGAVTVIVNATDADSFRRSERQIAESMTRAMRRAQR